MYQPTNLKAYERPSHFMGTEFPEYFSFFGQTRDSNCLERANFDAALKALGGEPNRTHGIIVARFNHWACGWVEVIFIHRAATSKLKIADKIKKDFERYPVVDEMLFSQYEDEAKRELYFNCFNLRDRIKECVNAGLSMFAARHDYIPDSIYDSLEV